MSKLTSKPKSEKNSSGAPSLKRKHLDGEGKKSKNSSSSTTDISKLKRSKKKQIDS
jgi:hypothetical protein